MSRSSQPRSSIVQKVRTSSPANPTAIPHRRSLARRFTRKLAAISLWLHIYVSMFGLATVLFFSVTGLTLNHPDWFFGNTEHTTQTKAELSPSLLNRPAPEQADGDYSAHVDKLQVVEHLRKTHKIRGALGEFRVDEFECNVTFKGPGYDADALIDRETGRYQLTETTRGIVAVLNDLHKGRDTGPIWSLVIDISAIVLTFIALTGLVLIFYLKLRRRPGLVIALLGTIILAALGIFGVP